MARIWLVSQMRRKDRTRFRGSTGRPVRVVKTRSVSGHAEPMGDAITGLLRSPGGERLAGEIKQWQVALSRVSLDRTEDEPSVNHSSC